MASYHYSIKSGKKGTALEHSRYVARTGKYAKRASDLTTTAHGNIPEWAKTPAEFWRAADKFERSNGTAYKEIVVALPNELTHQQHVDLVHAHINAVLKNKPYQFAIHSHTSAAANVPQPHAHIMFSNRVPDGEKRTPDQFFRRYNPTAPAVGGCRKDSGGKSSSELSAELVAQRAAWAVATNAQLERNGHAARVDHRSNRDRGIAAPPSHHNGPGWTRQVKNT